MQKTFVVDKESKPLLPCHPARSRKLLREGRAKIIQVVPFTIQLGYVIKNPIGSFTVGIDDGSKYVGIAVINDKTNDVVFKGEIQLRQDVKRMMKQRAMYRRARRSRKLRYRQPRFDNRISDKLAPSIKCRKDSILRWLNDMTKRVNIVKLIVEEVKFNHAKYRFGKWFSLVEQGKNYLKKQILNLGFSYEHCFGYETKEKRLSLGMSKKHSNDAIVICCNGGYVINSLEWIVKPRRTKIWANNPTKTCIEKNGFKHYDLVKARHKTKGSIVGSIKSLNFKAMTLRTKWGDNFSIIYRKVKLIQRFNGLIYCY